MSKWYFDADKQTIDDRVIEMAGVKLNGKLMFPEDYDVNHPSNKEFMTEATVAWIKEELLASAASDLLEACEAILNVDDAESQAEAMQLVQKAVDKAQGK